MGPHEYGTPVAVALSLKEEGRARTLPNGGRLWRLRIASPGARALRLSYSQFHLPPGGQFFVYDDETRVVHGAFTARNQKSDGRFATDLTPGSSVILEYYEPPHAAFSGTIQVDEVVHAWKAVGHPAPAKQASSYDPKALPCSINTACPAASDWSAQARATVLIDRGGSTCSGVLLNNTRGDHRPLVLTANHCGSPSPGQTVNWTFKFNYASSSCSAPSETPEYASITGATVRAADSGQRTDFTLLELSSFIPPAYNAYYAGWTLSPGSPALGVTLGHPKGDIRKIAFDDDPLLNYSTRWIATLDRGTAESGSSGSPLFNENHQVIGHLSSALTLDPNTCSGPGGDDNAAQVGFPKLSYNWNQGAAGQRLSDWLDPDGTGATSIGGQSGPPPSSATLWINEVDANSAVGSAEDDAEFVEIAGTAGADLGYADIEIYSCSNGAATLSSTQSIAPGTTLPDDANGTGFFVLGGPGLDATPDQHFSGAGTDVIPNGRGVVVLRDRYGTETFSYQYDQTQNGAPADCPTSRSTRSPGDDYTYPSASSAAKQAASSSASMGFEQETVPGASTSGTVGFVPSPGASNDTVMPVELSSFTALQDDDAILLRWTTASETNNAGFEIQRQRPEAESPEAWRTVSFVEGAGTTSEPQSYRYRLPAASAGTHVLRLRQVDFDGGFEYSPAVEITIAPKVPYRLSAPHPNPLLNQAAFTLTVAHAQQVNLAVYDLLGRRVAVLHQGSVSANAPHRFRIDAAAWPSGVYFLRARGERFTATQKLVVLR